MARSVSTSLRPDDDRQLRPPRAAVTRLSAAIAASHRVSTCSRMEIPELDQSDASPVAVDQLRFRHRVRRTLDAEHVERLTEVLDRCPPILVSEDGAIIDGEHRVAAARQLGVSEVPAIVVPVSAVAGAELLLAIEANASHGLPLSREERRVAVAAVLAVRPEMSDREIARVCGVGRGLVSTIRAATSCSGGLNGHLHGRIGGDGKRYGTLPPRWREHLDALVRCNPEMTVRALAERTGASVGAVQAHRRDLLERLAAEPRILRWWRRVRARWALRRSWAVDQDTP